MKKLLFFLVSAVVLFSSLVTSLAEITQTTDNEILFRGIPWGINIYDLRDKMAEIGYGSKNKEIEDYIHISSYERRGKLSDNYAFAGGNAGYGLEYDGDSALKKELFNVAGIDIWSVDVQCIFNVSSGVIERNAENSRYIQAFYTYFPTDNETTFNHLREKLTALYGNPEDYEDTSALYGADEVFTRRELSSIWYGANNTYVSIYTELDIKADSIIDSGIAYISYGVRGFEDDMNLINADIERLEREAATAEEMKKLEESQDSVDGL